MKGGLLPSQNEQAAGCDTGEGVWEVETGDRLSDGVRGGDGTCQT